MSPNKVALVTGAGVRIGAAIARSLHGADWNVAIHCRSSRAAADALAAQLNAARTDSAWVAEAELTQISALTALADAAQARWGRLDGLVNNASSYFATPLATLGESQFDDLVGSNLKAPLFLAQACARFESLSHIVNILDVQARRPLPRFAAYLAAKSGLWTLTEVLALELAPRVRVNAVAPGHMIWASESQLSPEAQKAELAKVPLGRLGGGEEIARAVRFLLSDDAAYLTGAVIPVDGGLRLA